MSGIVYVRRLRMLLAALPQLPTRSFATSLWSSLCFASLALNNAITFVDLVLFPAVDLFGASERERARRDDASALPVDLGQGLRRWPS